jgi:hypothetical protein
MASFTFLATGHLKEEQAMAWREVGVLKTNMWISETLQWTFLARALPALSNFAYLLRCSCNQQL